MSEQLLLTTRLRPPLVITQTDVNEYTARCGDRYEDRLDASEVLWVASCYVHHRGPGYLRTDAEHSAFWAAIGFEAPEREFV